MGDFTKHTELTALVDELVRVTLEGNPKSGDPQPDAGLTGKLVIEGDRWVVYHEGGIMDSGAGYVSFTDDDVTGVGVMATFSAVSDGERNKTGEITSVHVRYA